MICLGEPMLNLFCVMNFQGRELYLHDIEKYTFDIGLHPDIYESICFKLDMMLDTTKLTIWFQFEWSWLLFNVTRFSLKS